MHRNSPAAHSDEDGGLTDRHPQLQSGTPGAATRSGRADSRGSRGREGGGVVAVVVVATTDQVESEGFDRSTLNLPGRQDELVSRVATANARTVVVVNSGSPVEMPWRGDVAAVLLSWFPGQEAGAALADVLVGLTKPGGRLPTTWPATLFGLPRHGRDSCERQAHLFRGPVHRLSRLGPK